MTYKEIVDIFESSSLGHSPALSFASGPISFLDSNDQNRVYPYIFLRPVPSRGIQSNINTRVYELYSIDVPSIDNDSPTQMMSDCEQYGYDVLGRALSILPQDVDISINSVSPLWEAFQDRAVGWIYNISVLTTQTLPC